MNLEYPEEAKKNGISGRVMVSFTIEKDGSVTNVEAIRYPDQSLADEAVRVIKRSPKWTPGKVQGKPVRITYTFPVMFAVR